MFFGNPNDEAVLPERHEAGGIGERQRPQEHRVDDAEDGGRRADAECERDDRDGAEAGVSRQQSQRIVDVLQHRLDAAQAPRVAASFHVPGRMAEPRVRFSTRVVRGAALFLESPCAHLYVEAHLFFQIAVETIAGHERAQSAPQSIERHRVPQAGWMTRAMARVTRR